MRRNNRRDKRDEAGSIDFSKLSSFNQRGFSSGPREMHKAICADCKKECDVPFKPKEGRPVFCKECFAKHRPQR